MSKFFLEEKGKKIPWGVDIDTEGEKMLGSIIKEKFDCEIYFITKYPLKIKPFYTAPENFDLNDKYSRSFDLEYRGVEISSGGQMIHKHSLLVDRMKSMNIDPANFKFYLEAFNRL
ncbi:Aspartate--tRNA ligase (fragment) [groundwater metagenome]|uniref:Aspartate--tRNA ligase n=1 Tax=groundwater metagenome TaxID=717931 RepID=A0A098EEJ8_9ZZZZ